MAAREYELILDSGVELGRFQEMIDGYVQIVSTAGAWFPVFHRLTGFPNDTRSAR